MISNKTIKDKIRQSLININGYTAVDFPEIHVRQLHDLAVLIELLEVDQCGSVGGFGEGQKYPGRGFCLDVLTQRAKWVLAHG